MLPCRGGHPVLTEPKVPTKFGSHKSTDRFVLELRTECFGPRFLRFGSGSNRTNRGLCHYIHIFIQPRNNVPRKREKIAKKSQKNRIKNLEAPDACGCMNVPQATMRPCQLLDPHVSWPHRTIGREGAGGAALQRANADEEGGVCCFVLRAWRREEGGATALVRDRRRHHRLLLLLRAWRREGGVLPHRREREGRRRARARGRGVAGGREARGRPAPVSRCERREEAARRLERLAAGGTR